MSDKQVPEKAAVGPTDQQPKPAKEPPATPKNPLTDEQLFRAMGFTPGYLARKRETVPEEFW